MVSLVKTLTPDADAAFLDAFVDLGVTVDDFSNVDQKGTAVFRSLREFGK